ASLFAIGDSDWAVTTPDNRFEASPGAIPDMHWVLDGTVIDLDQLADRFTEPDLLPRMLGFTDTPIQDVSNASPVRLYPRIEFFDPQPVGSAARVRAINCGGGIGRTVVYLNNTEVISDARSSASEADASEMTLDIDVSASPVLNRDGRNL